ncbi:hypothetical protein FGO68_gene1186 [Halteria grandinella]|uniref:PIPK domain-containing protein n=1 Tax=Halteria grandinella TaxID=5974 RepID=A0A8J8T5V5_HALGN|nr:hypothetical protein FGO68_gene1186 [Halteria grandinella]
MSVEAQWSTSPTPIELFSISSGVNLTCSSTYDEIDKYSAIKITEVEGYISYVVLPCTVLIGSTVLIWKACSKDRKQIYSNNQWILHLILGINVTLILFKYIGTLVIKEDTPELFYTNCKNFIGCDGFENKNNLVSQCYFCKVSGAIEITVDIFTICLSVLFSEITKRIVIDAECRAKELKELTKTCFISASSIAFVIVLLLVFPTSPSLKLGLSNTLSCGIAQVPDDTDSLNSLIRIWPLPLCFVVLRTWYLIATKSPLQNSPTIATLSRKCIVLIISFMIYLISRAYLQIVFMKIPGNYESACTQPSFVDTRIACKILERLFPLIVAFLCAVNKLTCNKNRNLVNDDDSDDGRAEERISVVQPQTEQIMVNEMDNYIIRSILMSLCTLFRLKTQQEGDRVLHHTNFLFDLQKEYISTEQMPINIIQDSKQPFEVQVKDLYYSSLDELRTNYFNVSLERLRERFLLINNVLSMVKFVRGSKEKFKFTTQCNQFTINTLSREEMQNLKNKSSFIEQYAKHMQDNHKKSFLTRIIGLYEIKLPNNLKFNIMITDNLLGIDMKRPLKNNLYPVLAKSSDNDKESVYFEGDEETKLEMSMLQQSGVRLHMKEKEKDELLENLLRDLCFLCKDFKLEGYRLHVIELGTMLTMPLKPFVSHNNNEEENETETESYTIIDPTIPREALIPEKPQTVEENGISTSTPLLQSSPPQSSPPPSSGQTIFIQKGRDSSLPSTLTQQSQKTVVSEQIRIPYGHFPQGEKAFRLALIDLFSLPHSSMSRKNINATTILSKASFKSTDLKQTEMTSSEKYANVIQKYVKSIIISST